PDRRNRALRVQGAEEGRELHGEPERQVLGQEADLRHGRLPDRARGGDAGEPAPGRPRRPRPAPPAPTAPPPTPAPPAPRPTPAVKVLLAPSARTIFVSMNTSKPLFGDP